MERVGIRILGPFPITDNGIGYVFMAMEYLMKWPEAYAVPDETSATTVAELTDVVSRVQLVTSVQVNIGI